MSCISGEYFKDIYDFIKLNLTKSLKSEFQKMIFFFFVQNRKYSLFSPSDMSVTSEMECQNILVKMQNVRDSAPLLLC